MQRPGGTQRDVFQEQEDQALGPGVERGRLQVGQSGCVSSQRVLVFVLSLPGWPWDDRALTYVVEDEWPVG